jgi:hypothetical protein
MAVLKQAIATFDPATEKKKEIETALDLLFELAKSKCENFEKTILQLLRTAGTEENPTIPISQMINSYHDIRSYVTEDSANIINVITAETKNFITGGTDNVINGISTLLCTGINALLGAGTGVQAERKDYFIAVDGLSIIRVDIMSWMRRVDITGIKKRIDSALAFTIVKSSVDVNKITFNTFLQAYKYQLENSKISNDDLLREISEAKKVFLLLKDKEPDKTGKGEAILREYPSATVMSIIQ